MDYKSVIEEQIRELQKLQDKTEPILVEQKVLLATTISKLCFEANNQ